MGRFELEPIHQRCILNLFSTAPTNTALAYQIRDLTIYLKSFCKNLVKKGKKREI